MEQISDSGASEFQFVAFSLAGEEYGQEISRIREINRVGAITKIPHSPEYISGVVNLRGKIVPVIDMRVLLELTASDIGRAHRIMVVNVFEQPVGLLVDAVQQVLTIGEDVLMQSPKILRNVDVEFVKGVAKIDERLIVFLDIEKLISSKDLNELQTANVGETSEAPPK